MWWYVQLTATSSSVWGGTSCMRIAEKTIESQVVSHYLASGDYSGLPLPRLASDLGTDPEALLEVVVPLVKAGRVSLPSPFQTNPHVKMFKSSIEEQLRWFDERESRSVCLYPTAQSIVESVDLSTYDDRPFTKLMVLAYPKGLVVPFQLDVLESYQRDPRHEFSFSGRSGWIQMLDEYRDHLEESDRVDLFFGLGHDAEGDRVVVVYLYRLDRLSGKQQRIWKEFLVDGKVKVSEDYVTATLDGQPVNANSVYDAIVCEQVEINKLFELLERSPLFRETYEEQRPAQFSFFVKPTQGNYDEFVHLLDKMLPDNMDIKALGGAILRLERVEVGKGKGESGPKGSITMLEKWLSLRYPTAPLEERLAIIKPLRKVRSQRQKPAHKIVEDKYDKRFYTRQDELVWKVYEALRNLRCLLATDPSASNYEPSYWVREFPVKGY